MNKQHSSNDSSFGEQIHRYSRAQAIADGLLVDVTELAQEAGFRVPVALTAAVWADCVAWGEEDTRRQTYQDEQGRLWDVLWMAILTACRGTGHMLTFQLNRVPRGNQGSNSLLVTLKLCIGPGDSGEPVITLLMPNEE
jgi:hypothetical protein